MESAVKRFARNILLLHLVLLLAVLGLVLLASRAIRNGAREQALEQAERRQHMVASQTARGIEAFYHSIVNDMDLQPRADEDPGDRERLTRVLRDTTKYLPFFEPNRADWASRSATRPDGGRLDVNRSEMFRPDGPPRPENMKPDGRPPEAFRLDAARADAADARGQRAEGAGSPYPPGSDRAIAEAAHREGRPDTRPAATDRPRSFAEKPAANGGGRGAGGQRSDNFSGVRVDEKGKSAVAANAANGKGRPPGGGPRFPNLGLGYLLGRQLEERVDHLFILNRPNQGRGKLTIRDVTVKPADEDAPSAEELVARYESWLREIKEQSISHFELFYGHGYNLVAIPIERETALLVAAVKVSTIAEQYLAALNGDASTDVLLVNDALTVVAGSRANLVGVDISNSGDPDFAKSLQMSKAEGFHNAHVLEHPFLIGQEKFDPSLLTAEPLDVAGRKWFIVVGSPLKEVDNVVTSVFGRLFVWAVFVVIAVTAILVSTSIQMIRSRARMERVRTDALHKELDRARQIQQAWLPRETPQCPTIDVAAVNYPANHISGDFYNWFDLADGRVAVAIGDVTGHGMSAAFLMATTQLLVRTTLNRITDPAACMEEVNRQLCTLIFNGQFVTLQILVLDPDGGPVQVVSAGHPAPLLMGDDRLSPLPVDSQLVLGVDPDATYQTTTVDLPPGASILMYTDGAPDMLSANGQRLGLDGLRRAVPAGKRAPSSSAQWLLDYVVHHVNHFRGNHELVDDLTFVSISVTAATPVEQGELVGV